MQNALNLCLCKAHGEYPICRPGQDMNFRIYDITESIFWSTFYILQPFVEGFGPGEVLPQFKKGVYGTYKQRSNRASKGRSRQVR